MSQQLAKKQSLPIVEQYFESEAQPSVKDTPIKIDLSARGILRTWTYLAVKRLLDIIVSLLILVFAGPLMLIISLIVRMSSPGPAIYCQKRLTDGGKTFTMFKFRTMSSNAEASSGAVWAGENDPRIIPIGRFLRKTRLDELPQLFNVLVGDMSMVGPRPERPEIAKELAQELPSFYHRLEVKAGLTGLAQTGPGYAASLESYREKLAWDILYVRRKSIWLDLTILAKTVWVVLSGHGAR
jgi:lipopolysaccharide/colanic/teichoic acid biosynthesis glycosyltransferase